jgi:hypothetical protein
MPLVAMGNPPHRPRVVSDDNGSATVCLRLSSREYDRLYEKAQRAGVTVPEAIRRELRQAQRPPREDD